MITPTEVIAMKKSTIALASLFAVVWSSQASADLRKVFTAAAKAPTLARSARVVEKAALKTEARAGSFTTKFKDVHDARHFSQSVDSAGNLHTTTRRLADDVSYPGLRFESKQMTTPLGTTHKTTRIIDSKDATVAVPTIRNGGYPGN